MARRGIVKGFIAAMMFVAAAVANADQHLGPRLVQESRDDAASRAEAETELSRLRGEISSLEIRTLLSGEYDERDALVTIRSEAGGVDAADFAEMLMRMYLRWAERHGYPAEVYDTSFAEEAGIKSATFVVKAPFAYGTLSVEEGSSPTRPVARA